MLKKILATIAIIVLAAVAFTYSNEASTYEAQAEVTRVIEAENAAYVDIYMPSGEIHEWVIENDNYATGETLIITLHNADSSSVCYDDFITDVVRVSLTDSGNYIENVEQA